MTKTERKQTIMRAFFSFVLIAVLAVAMVIGGGFTAPTAYAATNDDLQFDETYVMDDLEGMTINGKPFDIADYSFDESRNTGVGCLRNTVTVSIPTVRATTGCMCTSGTRKGFRSTSILR